MATSEHAMSVWERFSPSAKQEYLEWILGAKREETTNKRLKQAVEWISEGKPRNWKYMEKWRS